MDIEVTLATQVSNMTITHDGANSPANQFKVFTLAFDSAGTDSCFAVDFGDGNIDLYGTQSVCEAEYNTSYPLIVYKGASVTSPMTLNHNYTADGQYKITAKGWNEMKTVTSETSHVVSTADCSLPTISIEFAKEKFYEIDDDNKFTRCQIVQVKGMSDINCNQTYSNTKQWNVSKVDQFNGTVERVIDITALSTTTTSELILQHRYLDEGIYLVSYTMTMNPSTDVATSSTAITYISVTKCDILVALFANSASFVEFGYDTDITISPATHSSDPGLSTGEVQVGF